MNNYWQGKTFSQEHRDKIGKAHKGMKRPPGTGEKISKANKGRKFTEEHIRKLSLSLKGRQSWSKGKKFSKEYRQKLSEAHKGKKSNNALEEYYKSGKTVWNKGMKGYGSGRKVSDETRLKMSQSQPKGEKHYNWHGGFNPYTIDWTSSLRISIRERDKYTCQLCSEKQSDISFSVHHIDYDKKNCNPNNLITLCLSCHMKTNFNREYWKEYFSNLT